jgi:hypothetical protein
LRRDEGRQRVYDDKGTGQRVTAIIAFGIQGDDAVECIL